MPALVFPHHVINFYLINAGAVSLENIKRKSLSSFLLPTLSIFLCQKIVYGENRAWEK